MKSGARRPARYHLPGGHSGRLALPDVVDHVSTAVHTLWRSLFGNDHPVEIEIGPGRGDVLLTFATTRPEVNFFAIEHARTTADRLDARLAHDGIRNARVIVADARCVVCHLVPDASVAAYHIYFPDPWPKRRHRARRVVDATIAAGLRRTLAPGGVVHVATDLPDLFAEIRAILVAGRFRAAPERASPQRPATRFERKYAAAGTHAGIFTGD